MRSSLSIPLLSSELKVTTSFRREDACYVIRRQDKPPRYISFTLENVKDYLLSLDVSRDASTRLIIDEDAIYLGHSLKEIEVAFPKLPDFLLSRTLMKSSFGERNFFDRYNSNARWDSDYSMTLPESRQLIDDRQAELQEKAGLYFSHLTPLKRKAIDAKALDAEKSPESILLKLMSEHDVLAIGEKHEDKASKKILFDAMPRLKASGVDVIFLEHVFDTQQAMLDVYMRSDRQTMPPMLQAYLERLDIEKGLSNAFPYNFTGLVMQAKKHGIRIVAIDTDASYATVKDEIYLAGKDREVGDPNGRGAMMNYLAFQCYETYRKQHVTRGKAIFFVGSAHLNKEHFGCPGIQELIGCPTVVVEDLKADAGMVSRVTSGREHVAHSDVVIAMRPDFSAEAQRMRLPQPCVPSVQIAARPELASKSFGQQMSQWFHYSMFGCCFPANVQQDAEERPREKNYKNIKSR